MARDWNQDLRFHDNAKDDGPFQARFKATLARFEICQGNFGLFAGFEVTPDDPADPELVKLCKNNGVEAANLRCATAIGLGTTGQLGLFIGTLKLWGWVTDSPERTAEVAAAKEAAKAKVAELTSDPNYKALLAEAEEIAVGEVYKKWIVADYTAGKFVGMKAITSFEPERNPPAGKAAKLRLRVFKLDPSVSAESLASQFSLLLGDLGAAALNRGKKPAGDAQAAKGGNGGAQPVTDPSTLGAAFAPGPAAGAPTNPKW